MYVGSVYSELYGLRSKENSENRWAVLIKSMFESLLLEYIPADLTKCITTIYMKGEINKKP